ncbi:MAG TPA: prephenate dehydrogenase/arogenate dehydrogenase family protein [Solirubrobacteraceae bacterium]|nr:prephenate dehydrogenase/arogenate dehydrogenase family protein [Solirubrobacteraceae bacterium]
MNVAVLGIGLIGGSIGLAVRQRAGARVCGYDPDEHVRAQALALGAIDTAAADVASAVHDADVVFVATPVSALPETVDLALREAPARAVVTDVGSTKRVVASARSDGRFIGGHPLAGAETAGVEHAREDLFAGSVWYLTPATGSAATAGVLYERLHRLLTALGARPTAIDAETHDRLLATVSHLPHALANLLVAQAASTLAQDGEGRVPAVGPSFRDATRVAGANSAIWTDIYLSNRDALIAAVDDFAARLSGLRAQLEAGDGAALTSWNEDARADRERLFGTAGAEHGTSELRVSVPNRPGVIAEIALSLGRAGVNILDMVLSPSPDNSQGVVALWIADGEDVVRAQELIAQLEFPVARA